MSDPLQEVHEIIVDRVDNTAFWESVFEDVVFEKGLPEAGSPNPTEKRTPAERANRTYKCMYVDSNV